jgi:hypothetical protein
VVLQQHALQLHTELNRHGTHCAYGQQTALLAGWLKTM